MKFFQTLALFAASTQAVKIDVISAGYNLSVSQEGSGTQCKDGDSASVHYTGTLQDGTKFDSSLDRNQPFDFSVGQGSVIKCWDHALTEMKVGEKASVTCPPDMAYGDQGAGDVIPGGATLNFAIEVLSCSS